MRELALHLLDIAENSIAARASNISIRVEENIPTDRLRMSVLDDGIGMDQDMVARVTDPFTTSRTTRAVGLGIPLLKAAAEACNGWLVIQSTLGKGTHVGVEFQRSHIDRMPLGNLSGTYLNLVIGVPHIHWVLGYQVNENEFIFDDAPIKAELNGISLTEPAVISFLRDYIEIGIKNIQIQDDYGTINLLTSHNGEEDHD